jgi:hypothetical protein
LAVEALLEGEAEALTRVCVERAEAGDSTALRLAMERVCPPLRERAIYDLPPDACAADLPIALGLILVAVAACELLLSEGRSARCSRRSNKRSRRPRLLSDSASLSVA